MQTGDKCCILLLIILMGRIPKRIFSKFDFSHPEAGNGPKFQTPVSLPSPLTLGKRVKTTYDTEGVYNRLVLIFMGGYNIRITQQS